MLTHKMLDQEVYVYLRRLILPHFTRNLMLILSIVLGVGGLLSISGLLESAQTSIKYKARDLLGADIVMSSWRSFDDEWSKKQQVKLSENGVVSQVFELATMAKEDHQQAIPKLITLKAIDSVYPLRGQLTVKPLLNEKTLGDSQQVNGSELKDNEIWIAASLWERLKNPFINISGRSFKVSAVIEHEPDAGFAGALSFSPRVMMNIKTLHQLDLLRFGSRVRRKLLFAHQDSQAIQHITQLGEQMNREAPEHIKVQSFDSGQANISILLERVGLFFIMVALLSLILCLLAFVSGVWTLINDQLKQIAIAHSLGITARSSQRAYSLFITAIALFGSLVAWGLSQGIFTLAKPILSSKLGFELSTSVHSSQAVIAISFAVLLSVLVNHITQRALARLDSQALWVGRSEGIKVNYSEILILALSLFAVICIYLKISSGSWWLGLVFSGLIIMLLILIMCLSFFAFYVIKLTLRLSHALPRPAGLTYALRQLLGYKRKVWLAILSIGLSFSLMGSLQLVSVSLMNALKLDDEKAPQIFLIDIQADQQKIVQQSFEQLDLPKPELRPLIRARISHINGEKVSKILGQVNTPADRLKQRSLTREFNLTTQTQLSTTEEVVKGTWWSQAEAQNKASRALSIETRFAQRMGLNIGDRLSFDIQGRILEFTITSERRVNWLSFAPNFIFSLPPAPLAGAPTTWISAAQLKKNQSLEKLSQLLYQKASNISVIDLRPILREGRTLLQSLTAMLKYSAWGCALAGLLLILHVMIRDRKRRHNNLRLLCDLGVSNKQAKRWLNLEMSLLGLIISGIVCLAIFLLLGLACQALNIQAYWLNDQLLIWLILPLLLPLAISILDRKYA